mmetsp:Transcript_46730/g.116471  ORF Transcript_46730/g.116471 Transcript_46730/m.116471 type:complete len:261 (+) Transcript_46730:1931-2713(+)
MRRHGPLRVAPSICTASALRTGGCGSPSATSRRTCRSSSRPWPHRQSLTATLAQAGTVWVRLCRATSCGGGRSTAASACVPGAITRQKKSGLRVSRPSSVRPILSSTRLLPTWSWTPQQRAATARRRDATATTLWATSRPTAARPLSHPSHTHRHTPAHTPTPTATTATVCTSTATTKVTATTTPTPMATCPCRRCSHPGRPRHRPDRWTAPTTSTTTTITTMDPMRPCTTPCWSTATVAVWGAAGRSCTSTGRMAMAGP